MQAVAAAGTGATPAAFYLGLCRLRGILSLPASPRLRCRRAILHRHDDCAASIRKSGPEIKNHRTETPEISLIYASIRKSGLEIKNRCTDCPRFDLLAASIRKSGPEIENRCSVIVPTSRTARLQRSRGVQAGTGCHEGGIILSKKPPEWRLSTPHQRSASDSNLRCRSEE